MVDNKYQSIIFDRSVIPEDFGCKTPKIGEVASTFRDNIFRIFTLSEFPVLLIYLSQLSQQFVFQVIHEKTGKYSIGPGEGGDPDEDGSINNLIQRNIQRVADVYGRRDVADRFNILTNYSGNINYWGFHLVDEVSKAFDALCATTVIGTWTAFETMASDLWESSVNACPQKLASLKGKPNTIGDMAGARAEKSERTGGESSNRGGQNDEPKSISLERAKNITGGTFDLSGCMGSLLKGNRKFTMLAGIREAYSLAFYDHATFVEEALSDKSLDALSLVRNLLVHKAAVADDEYVNRLATVPLAPKIAKGERLHLDGDLVRSLVSPVVTNSIKLIKSVDSYILR